MTRRDLYYRIAKGEYPGEHNSFALRRCTARKLQIKRRKVAARKRDKTDPRKGALEDCQWKYIQEVITGSKALERDPLTPGKTFLT